MLIPIGFFGGAVDKGAFDHLASAVLSATASSITFDVSSYATDYKHLQIRGLLQGAHNGSGYMNVRFNGASSPYRSHFFGSNGPDIFSFDPTTAGNMQIGTMYGNNNSNTTEFTATMIDILDPFSSSKNKTVKGLNAYIRNSSNTDREISFSSGAWFSTSAVTSITLSSSSGNLNTNTSLYLYGIKG